MKNRNVYNQCRANPEIQYWQGFQKLLGNKPAPQWERSSQNRNRGVKFNSVYCHKSIIIPTCGFFVNIYVVLS